MTAESPFVSVVPAAQALAAWREARALAGCPAWVVVVLSR